MAEKYIVNGYEFDTKEQAKEGRKEYAAVQYLSKKVKEGTLEEALDIYEKILSSNMFHTRIGIDYLQTLKNYLADNDVIKDNTKEGMNRKIDQLSKQLSDEQTTNQKKTSKIKDLLYTSLILNLVLAIVIVVMLVISSTSDNVNIINYENALQDRYSSWEAELQSKEVELRKYEQSLHSNNK